MKKIYVLDTNVLLHTKNALHKFQDNIIVLTFTVLEELDKFKDGIGEINRNARKTIKILDELRSRGRLTDGVENDNGGIVRIELNHKKTHAKNPADIDLSVPDNRILTVAYNIILEESEKEEPKKVIFVSMDINARLKGDALGIEVQEFKASNIDVDELYTGWINLSASEKQISKYNLSPNISTERKGLRPNQFILFKNKQKKKNNIMVRYLNGCYIKFDERYGTAYGINSRNMEQRMALELLLNPEIRLVTLVGGAGTGKTLLALAAGLANVVEYELYDGLNVARPIVPMGKEIGYLPGGKDEKLKEWMKPIYDNLDYIIKNSRKSPEDKSSDDKIAQLAKNLIDNEALMYIRGRSITDKYVIIDEAQNLTPQEVKTIISRAGEGTKMVFTGDPDQIDNPYLDKYSNGLMYAVERIKNREVYGHITLKTSERSALAQIAIDDL